MKLESSNPIVGAIAVVFFLGMCALLPAAKDSLWIVAIFTILCAAIGGFIAHFSKKNFKGSVIIGAAIGLIAGIVFYAAV